MWKVEGLIKIIIGADPVPGARPRFDGKHAYQPARNREYRQEVQMAATLTMRGREPLRGPISVEVKLYRKYKRTSRKFGDVDNHLKALFDGLNGIAFLDDSQIVSCSVEKLKDAKNPRTEVIIGDR